MKFVFLVVLVCLILDAVPEVEESGPSARSARVHGKPELAADACTGVKAIVDSLPGTFTEVIHGTFHDDLDNLDRPGCLLLISGNWSELGGRKSPVDLIFDTLTGRGWRQDLHGGDGPDGTFFALIKDEVICIVRGRWDGGDDADSTYVPSDTYQVIVLCAPLEEEDKRRLREE